MADTPDHPDEPPTQPTPPSPPTDPGTGSWWADPSPPPGDGGPAGATSPSSSPRRAALWVGAAVVALGLVGGGVAFAATRDDGGEPVAAATDPTGAGGQTGPVMSGRGPSAAGDITAIDGTTLTVEAADGTVSTVTTDDETSVTDSTDATVADVEVGDQVTVLADGSDDGTDGEVAAARIIDGRDVAPIDLPGGVARDANGQPPTGMTRPDGMTPPEGMELPDGATPPEGMTPPDGAPQMRTAGPAALGEVTAVDGDTLTVLTEDGDEVVVTTTDETDVEITTEITVADLAVGDPIVVQGEADGDTVAAESIRRGEDLVGDRMGGPGDQAPRGAADDGATTSTTEA